MDTYEEQPVATVPYPDGQFTISADRDPEFPGVTVACGHGRDVAVDYRYGHIRVTIFHGDDDEGDVYYLDPDDQPTTDN